MTLWFLFALMTAVAVFAVLSALARQRSPRAGSDLAVYRDQLDEIGRDRAAGRIGEVEAEAARVEVSRRLIGAADTAQAVAATASGAPWRRRAAAVVALVALPLGAVALYLAIGSPSLPDQPLATRQAAPLEKRPVDSLVAQIEAHLEAKPEDGRGWEVVAPVYARLGRYSDAAKAWRNAIRLNGETAQRQGFLGEVLMAAGNGVVTDEAKAAFERTLVLDPKDVSARFYLGLAAMQDGKRDEAAARWRALIASAPPDAPWVGFVDQALARLEGRPVAQAPGPTAEDAQAAAELPPDQQQAMIRGMVARLADRLKNDGSDLDAWIRLMRAYMVLGERDRATAALADARRALAADADKVRQLDAAAKNLGVEG